MDTRAGKSGQVLLTVCSDHQAAEVLHATTDNNSNSRFNKNNICQIALPLGLQGRAMGESSWGGAGVVVQFPMWPQSQLHVCCSLGQRLTLSPPAPTAAAAGTVRALWWEHPHQPFPGPCHRCQFQLVSMGASGWVLRPLSAPDDSVSPGS